MRKVAPLGAVESIARMPTGAPITLSRMVSPVTVPESAIAAAGASMFAIATTISRAWSAMLNPERTEIAGCFPVQIIARFSMTTELLSSMLNTPPAAASTVAGPWPLMRSEFAPRHAHRLAQRVLTWTEAHRAAGVLHAAHRLLNGELAAGVRFGRDALRAGSNRRRRPAATCCGSRSARRSCPHPRSASRA